MSVVPAFCLIAAAMYMLAARSYEADMKNVEGAVRVGSGGLEPQAA
jgi:hypothetical protein